MDLRSALGRVGIWSTELRGAGRPDVGDAAAELSDLGYQALWLPGAGGDGLLEDVAHVLDSAAESHVVTGVLNIWGQSPAELSDRVARFDETYGERTVVGLGIGSPAGAAAHGLDYGTPVDTMTHYLDGVTVPSDRLLLGALGPKMVDLAVARTAGWHPFLVTPEYVADARARVGERTFVAPHQAVVLDTDPGRARAAARAGIGMFLGFPTYRANVKRLGFTDDDLVPGGSDRLIDALVAHGTLDDIARRVRAHHDAGADHVALHVLTSSTSSTDLPLAQWRELAALLKEN